MFAAYSSTLSGDLTPIVARDRQGRKEQLLLCQNQWLKHSELAPRFWFIFLGELVGMLVTIFKE
jgi:hypothetical protein